MKEFINAVLSTAEDVMTCDACQEALLDYVEAQMMQTAEIGQFAALAHHLQVCPYCSREAQTLQELMTLTSIGALPVAVPETAIDLAFLEETPLLVEQRSTTRQRTYWWDAMGRLILQFSAEFLASLQAPAFTPAYASVKAEREGERLYQFTLTEPQQDLAMTVSIQSSGDDPDHCSLDVEVNIPSRGGWPHLGEIEVRLKQGSTPLAVQTTNAFGLASFDGIARSVLSEIVIEVDPNSIPAEG